MDKRIEELAASPINTAARASKIFVPFGKRAAPKAERREIRPEDAKASREYREREASAKVKALLDYYATTTVPFERIADHMKMTVGKVRESMGFRGRVE